MKEVVVLQQRSTRLGGYQHAVAALFCEG